MKAKTWDIIDAISLMIIVFTALFLFVTSFLCIALPGIVVSVLVIASLISLPILVFSNIKNVQNA